jgi:hypothetical protein
VVPSIAAPTDRHEYELYLAVEDIDHTKTKVKSPQTNGICERFHKTLLDEFYRVAFRKKVYDTADVLQVDLDEWMVVYNEQRTHQGRWCFGKTPMQTFLDTAAWAREKRQGSIEGVHDSFDPADTHHARSMVCQIKYKLLHINILSPGVRPWSDRPPPTLAFLSHRLPMRP